MAGWKLEGLALLLIRMGTHASVLNLVLRSSPTRQYISLRQYISFRQCTSRRRSTVAVGGCSSSAARPARRGIRSLPGSSG